MSEQVMQGDEISLIEILENLKKFRKAINKSIKRRGNLQGEPLYEKYKLLKHSWCKWCTSNVASKDRQQWKYIFRTYYLVQTFIVETEEPPYYKFVQLRELFKLLRTIIGYMEQIQQELTEVI